MKDLANNKPWVDVISGPEIRDFIIEALKNSVQDTLSEKYFTVKICGDSKIKMQGLENAFDLSENKDNSCILYTKGDTIYIVFNNEKYKGIMLNADSSKLFSIVIFKDFETFIKEDLHCYFSSIEGLNYLNTSKVKNMSEMFYNCYKIKELDLSSFNTSNVTNMSSMFSNCYCLENLDLSNFNTSKVKDMSDMFGSCESLTKLNLDSFDTSNVEDMHSMFGDASIESFNLLHFNTSKVKNMHYMFGGQNLAGPDYLVELDLSTWDLSNVQECRSMFYARSRLAKIKLKSPSQNFINQIKKDLPEDCLVLDSATNEEIDIKEQSGLLNWLKRLFKKQ